MLLGINFSTHKIESLFKFSIYLNDCILGKILIYCSENCTFFNVVKILQGFYFIDEHKEISQVTVIM